MHDQVIRNDKKTSSGIFSFVVRSAKHTAWLSGSILGVALCVVFLQAANHKEQEGNHTGILAGPPKDVPQWQKYSLVKHLLPELQ